MNVIAFQKKKVQIQEETLLKSTIEPSSRMLNTVQEVTLASGTFSRSGSLRMKKKNNTPRPMWKY